MQDNLNSERMAHLSHLGMARDHHTARKQTIGCPNHMLDQRHTIQLGHKLVRSKPGAHARCHDNAARLCFMTYR